MNPWRREQTGKQPGNPPPSPKARDKPPLFPRPETHGPLDRPSFTALPLPLPKPKEPDTIEVRIEFDPQPALDALTQLSRAATKWIEARTKQQEALDK